MLYFEQFLFLCLSVYFSSPLLAPEVFNLLATRYSEIFMTDNVFFISRSLILLFFISSHYFCIMFMIFQLILGREKGRGRERSSDLLFHLFMHSFVDSCMCPDQGLKVQPWHIRTMLQPPKLSSQGESPLLFICLSKSPVQSIPLPSFLFSSFYLLYIRVLNLWLGTFY